jgi:hypothetical protein
MSERRDTRLGCGLVVVHEFVSRWVMVERADSDLRGARAQRVHAVGGDVRIIIP